MSVKIKTGDEIDKMRTAGRLAAQVLEMIDEHVKPGITTDELNQICQGKGITIARRLVGNYITSLDMAGCSITLLKADNELLELWDAPVHTPALRWGA